VNVPYKGAVGITDLLAGHVQMAFAGLPQSLPHTRTGRLRALAVTTPARSTVLPDIPTLSEAGVPGYDVTVWYGMIAPAGTPRAVIRKLNSDVVSMLKSADVRQILGELGIDPVGSTPEQFAATIRQDIEKWLKMAKRGGTRSE
jgi:tripartite-type tricarboxylate transporter receptor subunit TctC